MKQKGGPWRVQAAETFQTSYPSTVAATDMNASLSPTALPSLHPGVQVPGETGFHRPSLGHMPTPCTETGWFGLYPIKATPDGDKATPQEERWLLLLTGSQRMDTGGQSAMVSTPDSQVSSHGAMKRNTTLRRGNGHVLGPE